MEPNILVIISLASAISIVMPLAMYLLRMKNAAKRIHIVGAIIIGSAVCDLISIFLIKDHSSTVI